MRNKSCSLVWLALILFAWPGFTGILVRADVLDHWTASQIRTNLLESQTQHVVYGNGLFVAYLEDGDNGVFYSSVDGQQWQMQATNPNAWGLSLTFSGGMFVGVSGFGWIASSTNGTNWAFSSLPGTLFDDYNYRDDVTFGKGLYVEAGDANGVANIVTSPEGVNWTAQTLPNPGAHISGIAFSGGRFVAIGPNDGNIYYSTTGKTWFQTTIPGGNTISYANGNFYIPYGAGTNLVSPDGATWTPYLTGLTNLLGKIIYANGVCLAAAGGHLASSTDGTNWVQYPPAIPGNSEIASDGFQIVRAGITSPGPAGANGFVYSSGPLVGLRLANAPQHQPVLSGLVGRFYRIDAASTLAPASTNWQMLTMIQLTNTPWYFNDVTITNVAVRFYRAALLP